VLAHARALLTSGPTGVTDYIDADLRDTGKILQAAARTLDFSQPVAIMLMAIGAGGQEPCRAVGRGRPQAVATPPQRVTGRRQYMEYR
jgi:S-adenosyl methyltransferase